MSTYVIPFHGPVPCKKNGKNAWGGRVVIDPAKKKQIKALEWQVQIFWRGKTPIETLRRLTMVFQVKDGASDLDGKYTTMQDVLVKGGVIKNDSIKRIPSIAADAVIVPGEMESVVVTIETSDKALPIKERRSGRTKRSGDPAGSGAGASCHQP